MALTVKKTMIKTKLQKFALNFFLKSTHNGIKIHRHVDCNKTQIEPFVWKSTIIGSIGL